MAGGSWTTKHIISDLPAAQRAAYAQFFRSPCIMANVAVRNWRFLSKLGITGCRWFGGSLGNYISLPPLALLGGVASQFSPGPPPLLPIKIPFFPPGLC